MCADGVCMFDGRSEMMNVKSEFMSDWCCPSLNDYDGALIVVRAWQTGGRVLREESIYAGQDFEAQKRVDGQLCAYPREARREGKSFGCKCANSVSLHDDGRECRQRAWS